MLLHLLAPMFYLSIVKNLGGKGKLFMGLTKTLRGIGCDHRDDQVQTIQSLTAFVKRFGFPPTSNGSL